MDIISSIDLGRILIGEQPGFYISEIIFRVLFIYFFSLIFLRAGGKRSRQQVTPNDVLMMVALGSVVGDVMFNPSVSLLYAGVIILTIVLLQYLIAKIKQQSNALETFIDSKPIMLIKWGKWLEDQVENENITKDEVRSALRLKGVRNLEEVEYAFLEITGNYSIFLYQDGKERFRGENIIPDNEEVKFWNH